ncbi:hypothetical protein MRX96_045750 [Rhipicephalus microplus]
MRVCLDTLRLPDCRDVVPVAATSSASGCRPRTRFSVRDGVRELLSRKIYLGSRSRQPGEWTRESCAHHRL